MTIPQADSTLNAILTKVRRLTASSGNTSLTDDAIYQYVNTTYSHDFPYAIKLDQMRSVYTFYTSPYVSIYPLNINYNQGIRAPVQCDGINMSFFKDRQQFYNMWPKFPTLSYPITGDGSLQAFTFTCQTVPFLPREVTLGGTDTNGNPIRVSDDGKGNLLLQVPNPVIPVPAAPTPPYVIGQIPTGYNLNTQVSRVLSPGMVNNNVNNSGDNIYQPIIGTVDYVTGDFDIDFASASGTYDVIPAKGEQMNLFVSQSTSGRPLSLLFWNNEFQIRPVPKLVHKIEVEAYLTPVQFLATTESPILNQWWQWLAISAAVKILEDRQDMEGVSNLQAMLAKQEALILERQGTEEINQRNSTIFSGTQSSQGWNQYGSQGGCY